MLSFRSSSSSHGTDLERASLWPRPVISKVALIAMLLPLLCAVAAAQGPPTTRIYGPGVFLDARFWNTPGWQPRDGDYAYVRLIPGRNAVSEVQRALKDIPATHRMVLSPTVGGLEELLRQLIEGEGFRLASLGYEPGNSRLTPGTERRDLTEACKRGQALARRLGLKFLVSITQEQAKQAGKEIAACADMLTIQDGGRQENAVAAIEEQRKLYQKILTANPSIALFHNVPAALPQNPEPPGRLLRYYRGNADLVRGIIVRTDSSNAQSVGSLVRAIRPPLGQGYAVARDQGPAMYFFNFHWNTPGWQPREGDYAFTKVRPFLKTLAEKVAYVLEELKDIAPERRRIMFNGLAGADELLHELIEVRGFRIAAMDYDLEQWELTPQEEKADPIAACKRGQALAAKYKLSFAVVPDFPMSNKWGVIVAPFVEGIAPQSKGLQAKNIDDAIVHQRKLYSEIRRANPDVILYHDLAISPKGVLQSVEGLLHYYGGVADLVDGIEVWSGNAPAQRAVMEKYIIGVRPPWRGDRSLDEPGK